LVLHAWLQAPQLFKSSVVLVSQPLLGLPSQLPHPVKHAVTVQVDVLHDSSA
jgi:hypothetical protein